MIVYRRADMTESWESSAPAGWAPQPTTGDHLLLQHIETQREVRISWLRLHACTTQDEAASLIREACAAELETLTT